MKQWWIQTKRADFVEIGRRFGIDRVTARVLTNRDVNGDEAIDRYLNGTLSMMYDPALIKDIDKAAEIVWKAVDSGDRIRIIGDYDVDGVCSIYILYKGLKNIGAFVDYDIPDRSTDGYGISENLIKKAYEDGVRLIITCDNGIAAVSQTEYAKSLGISVVVTDHHDVQFVEKDGETVYSLPSANAIIDSKRPDDGYPFKLLCGAAVAFKFVKYICDIRNLEIYDEDDAVIFASLATICDMVELVDENRIIAAEGLKKLPHTANKGLKALIKANGISLYDVDSYNIGFRIGPCLNASGRLETAKKAERLLLTENDDEALSIANELIELNQERKALTQKATDKACSLVNDTSLINDKVLVIYLPDCHPSVAGIAAGRVREKFGRPSIVLAGEGDEVKGSGRSIENYNMFEKLNECKDLFVAFGGHPMAAGLTIKADRIEELRRRLNDDCGLSEDDLVEKIWIDDCIPFKHISEELVDDLKKLEPFGNGNSKPVFAQKNIKVKGLSSFGDGKYTNLLLEDSEGSRMTAVAFFQKDGIEEIVKNNGRIDCIFYPEINKFRDQKNTRIVVTDFRESK